MSATERKVLGAASGMPLDAEGRPVGDIESPQYRDFARLANQVAFDRLDGRLKTEVSADYIANLARTNSSDPSSRLNADMLDRALQILSGARSSAAADYPLDVRA